MFGLKAWGLSARTNVALILQMHFKYFSQAKPIQLTLNRNHFEFKQLHDI